MACRLFVAKPLFEPILILMLIGAKGKTLSDAWLTKYSVIWKMAAILSRPQSVKVWVRW